MGIAKAQSQGAKATEQHRSRSFRIDQVEDGLAARFDGKDGNGADPDRSAGSKRGDRPL
jgi:hypothetical protein